MSATQAVYRKFYGLKAKYHFLKFIQDPTNTPGIFEMTESFQKAAPPEIIEMLLKPMFENPSIQAAFAERYWPKIPTLQQLEGYPPGSFGHEAFLFFKKWNLDVDLFPEPDFSSMQAYLTSRIYQSHDFWHVLAGYDTSLEQELALQAFGVGQYKQPISLAIIAGGLIHVLQKHPDQAVPALAQIADGFERGSNAANLLTSPIFEKLFEPLAKVRSDLNIAPPGKM